MSQSKHFSFIVGLLLFHAGMTFAGNAPLRLDASIPKQRYRFGEFVELRVSFQNTSDQDIYVSASPLRLSTPVDQMWTIKTDDLQVAGRLQGSGLESTLLLVPAHGATTFVRKGFLLPPGKISFRIVHENSRSPISDLAELDGAWTGRIESNEVSLTSTEEPLGEVERRRLDRAIGAYLQLVRESSAIGDHQAVQAKLLMLMPYSREAVREGLGDKRYLVRHDCAFVLGQAAQIEAAQLGLARDTSSLPLLLAAAEQERHPLVQSYLAGAIEAHADIVTEADVKLIAPVLSRWMKEGRDVPVQAMASRTYLALSPQEAIPMILEMIEEAPPQSALRSVLFQVLEAHAEKRFGNDVDRVREWWNTLRGE